jgi:hypothetical protein
MIGRSGGMILHLALDGVGAARSSPAPARAKCFVWCLGAHSLWSGVGSRPRGQADEREYHSLIIRIKFL